MQHEVSQRRGLGHQLVRSGKGVSFQRLPQRPMADHSGRWLVDRRAMLIERRVTTAHGRMRLMATTAATPHASSIQLDGSGTAVASAGTNPEPDSAPPNPDAGASGG